MKNFNNFSVSSISIIFLICSHFMTSHLGESFVITTNYYSYNSLGFAPQIRLSCGGYVDYEYKSTIRYYIGQTLIFDSETPKELAPFVIDRKDGTIELIGRDRREGYEEIFCERDGMLSDNNITIHAVNDLRLQVTPKRFQFDYPIQMECLFSIAPPKNVKYTGFIQLQNYDINKRTRFVRIDYDQSDPNNRGTVLYESIGALSAVPGEDKSKFYANVSMINPEAAGGYTCHIQIDSTFSTKTWNTDDWEDDLEPTTESLDSDRTTTTPKPPVYEILSDDGTYDYNDRQTLPIMGPRLEFNTSRHVQYFLGNEVIYDSHSDNTASFVINRKTGEIELITKNRPEGFEDLYFEADGIRSKNNLTIYALSNHSFQVAPNRFEIGKPIEVECAHTLAPQRDLVYYASLYHKNEYGTTTLAWFNQNTNGTQVVLTATGKTIWNIQAGEDWSRFSMTITPLNWLARGEYSCTLRMKRIYFWYTEWFPIGKWISDDWEVTTTEIPSSSTELPSSSVPTTTETETPTDKTTTGIPNLEASSTTEFKKPEVPTTSESKTPEVPTTTELPNSSVPSSSNISVLALICIVCFSFFN